MSGSNPYLKTPKIHRALKKYTITFLPEEKTVEVHPEQAQGSSTGLPGSLLDLALKSEMEMDHACGGVCACATCHIIIRKGFESCHPTTDQEEDQLEKAPGLTPQSRLACQCVPNGTENLVVEIPSWNRNLVRE